MSINYSINDVVHGTYTILSRLSSTSFLTISTDKQNYVLQFFQNCEENIKKCEILQSMNCNNLPHYVQHFEEKSFVVLVSQVPESDSIKSIISSVEPAVKMKWMAQILYAVQSLHINRIAHKQIKFQNIVIEKQQQNAILTEIQIGNSKEEQLIEAESNDLRIDILSLGCIWYEIVSGRFPFQGKTENEIKHQIEQMMYQPLLRSQYPDYQNELQLIPEMLSSNPVQRYTAQQLVEQMGIQKLQSATISQMIIKSRYKLLDQIGVGSFGECFKATDMSTGKTVVVKKSLGNSQVEDIELEARMLEAANHPNIAHCIEHFWEEQPGAKKLIIVMDFYSGGDIRHFLLKQGENYSFNDIDEFIIKKWMLQLLHAVTYLHEHGIIHRDLKLENCFLDDELNLYLGDFGLAKQIEGSVAKTMAGTIDTMAPEILLKQKYGSLTDIWSLGCIWFELITGSKPFQGDGLYLQAQLIIKAEYSPPKQTRFKVFEKLIQQMICVDQEKRINEHQLQSQLQVEWQQVLSEILRNKQSIMLQNRYSVNLWGNVITQGSYYTSYKGFDTKTGRNVIIQKIIINDEEQVKIIAKEVEILEIFQHSNILRRNQHFTDSVNGQQCLIIVLDWLDNNIHDVIDKSQQIKDISSDVIIKWMLQILEAYSFLRENHIIVYDASLKNVFLDSNNNIKIGDIGFIIQQHNKSANILNSINTKAPEVIENGVFQEASNIWSLGCLWYEMISGKQAFETGKIPIMDQILLGDYEKLSNVKYAQFEKAIGQMIVVDPLKRLSIEQFIKMFQNDIDQFHKKEIVKQNDIYLLIDGNKNEEVTQQSLSYTESQKERKIQIESSKPKKCKMNQKIIYITLVAAIVIATVTILLLTLLPKNKLQCNSNTIQVGQNCTQCPSNSEINIGSNTCICNQLDYQYNLSANLCQCKTPFSEMLSGSCQLQCPQQQNIVSYNYLQCNNQFCILAGNQSLNYNNSNIYVNLSQFSSISYLALFENFNNIFNIQITEVNQNSVLLNYSLSLISYNTTNIIISCLNISAANISISNQYNISFIQYEVQQQLIIQSIIISILMEASSQGNYYGLFYVVQDSDNVTINILTLTGNFSSQFENNSIILQQLQQSNIYFYMLNITISGMVSLANSSFLNNYVTQSNLLYNVTYIQIGTRTNKNDVTITCISQQSFGGYYNNSSIIMNNSAFRVFYVYEFPNTNSALSFSGLLFGIIFNDNLSVSNSMITGHQNYANSSSNNENLGVIGQTQTEMVYFENVTILFNLTSNGTNDSYIGPFGTIIFQQNPSLILLQCYFLIQMNATSGNNFNAIGYLESNSQCTLLIFSQSCLFQGIILSSASKVAAFQINYQYSTLLNITDDYFDLTLHGEEQVGIIISQSNISTIILQVYIILNINGSQYLGISLIANELSSNSFVSGNITGTFNLGSQGTNGVLFSSLQNITLNIQNLNVSGNVTSTGNQSGIIIGLSQSSDVLISNCIIQVDLKGTNNTIAIIVGEISQNGSVTISNVSWQNSTGVNAPHLCTNGIGKECENQSCVDGPCGQFSET